MKRIGLLSDTHSFLDDSILRYFGECDEVWHAGDIGDAAVVDRLEAFRPLRAVYGNIDEPAMRRRYPEDLRFECEGVDVFITHIGGYPGRYSKRAGAIIRQNPPRLFICGHSHILKVMPDKRHGLLHINPGAAGRQGFHKVRTVVRFTLEYGDIRDLQVIELGLRVDSMAGLED